jgi:hypothetical protein
LRSSGSLSYRRIHGIDADGFGRLSQEAFQRANIIVGGFDRKTTFSQFNELKPIPCLNTQALSDIGRNRDLALAGQGSSRHGETPKWKHPYSTVRQLSDQVAATAR